VLKSPGPTGDPGSCSATRALPEQAISPPDYVRAAGPHDSEIGDPGAQPPPVATRIKATNPTSTEAMAPINNPSTPRQTAALWARSFWVGHATLRVSTMTPRKKLCRWGRYGPRRGRSQEEPWPSLPSVIGGAGGLGGRGGWRTPMGSGSIALSLPPMALFPNGWPRIDKLLCQPRLVPIRQRYAAGALAVTQDPQCERVPAHHGSQISSLLWDLTQSVAATTPSHRQRRLPLAELKRTTLPRPRPPRRQPGRQVTSRGLCPRR
jgi:hypothetical protein